MKLLSKSIIILSLVIFLLPLGACTQEIKSLFFRKRMPTNEKMIQPNSATEEEAEILKENKERFESLKPKTEAIPKSGIYDKSFRLKLVSSNIDAEIFYSTDMKNYDIKTFSKYETPIIINQDTSIRYYGTHASYVENVHEDTYKINTITEITESEEESKIDDNIKGYLQKMNIQEP